MFISMSTLVYVFQVLVNLRCHVVEVTSSSWIITIVITQNTPRLLHGPPLPHPHHNPLKVRHHCLLLCTQIRPFINIHHQNSVAKKYPCGRLPYPCLCLKLSRFERNLFIFFFRKQNLTTEGSGSSGPDTVITSRRSTAEGTTQPGEWKHTPCTLHANPRPRHGRVRIHLKTDQYIKNTTQNRSIYLSINS